MKLTINKIYKNVNMMIEVELLSEPHQNQLDIAVKSSFGNKKLTVKKAITKEDLSVDFSEILDEKGNILYDFWELNVDTGKLFTHNTTELLGIVMIQSGFTVDDREATDQETSLIADLEAANKTHSLGIYKYNDNQEIIDFIDTPVPKNSKAWTEFISSKSVGEDLINIYNDKIDKKCWDNISRFTKCSEKLIDTFMDKVNWDFISSEQNLSEYFIDKHSQRINWKLLSANRKTILSEEFMDKFQIKLDWKEISKTQKLSESFIIGHSDRIDWKEVSWYQTLSNEFILTHREKLNLKGICYNQKMTEDTIRECLSEFNKDCWSGVSWKQTLSIPFLEEFGKKIDWKEFSKNRGRSLTEEVLRKYAKKIHWYTFITDWSGPGLSEELVKEFLPYFSRSSLIYLLEDPDNFPLSKEYKKQLNEMLKQTSD